MLSHFTLIFLCMTVLMIAQLPLNNATEDDDDDDEKSSWPELVGKTGRRARRLILRERPDLDQVVIVGDHDAVTDDLRLDRVRIFVDQSGHVSVTPSIG